MLYDADGKEYLDFITGLAVVSLGHAHPAVADAVAEQARTLSHVSNLYGNTLAPEVARTIDRLINGGTGQAGGPGFLRQLGGRGERVRAEAGPALGGRRPPRRHQHRQRVPRPHAGHADRDGPAREAGAVPAAARGLRARALRRRRRAGQGARPRDGGRRLLEPIQGEGGVVVPSSDYLGAVRELCTRAQRAADARRDPDRARPHGPLVRVPGPGARARRRDHGQGARQRHARRRVLGARRGGRRVRAGRPRLDLRRPAAGARRGQGDARRDGGRGRVRPRPSGRGAAGRGPGRAARRRLGARRRAAAGSAAVDAGRQGGGGQGAGAGPAGERGPARTPCGWRHRCS